MNSKYYQYRYTQKRLPGWLMVIIGSLGLAAFFLLALPIFLAAMVVFGAIGAYFAYKIKKTIDQVEKAHFEHFNKTDLYTDEDEFIIDINPDDIESDCRDTTCSCKRLPR